MSAQWGNLIRRVARQGSLCHVYGRSDAMRTTIDRAGLLVIPRRLRDLIGLAGGGEVEIELDGGAIRIEPVGGSSLREEDGLLVIPSAGTSPSADRPLGPTSTRFQGPRDVLRR